MSSSIFGDDDDFELVGGSDTPSANRKPPTVNPVRPVAQRTPSTPASSSADESQNAGNRTLPAVPASSALPRPQLPSPTSKEVPPASSRRALRSEKPQAAPIPPTPVQDRPAETVKQPLPPVREVRRRDTTPTPELPVVATIDDPRNQTFENPERDPRPATPPVERLVDNKTVESGNTSRRSIRDTSNSYDDFAATETETNSAAHREEAPTNFYRQTPYTPAENHRPEPSRHTEQPIQSYPQTPATAPAPERLRQDAPVEKKQPAKSTRSTKAKAGKAPKDKGPSSFSGGRAGVMIVRVVALVVVAVLMLAGAKSLFFPPQIPDPTTVTNVVKKRLGVTNFPTENGQAFVTSFARIYFTVDPANSNSNDVYAPYMSSNLVSSMTASSGAASKQTITEGPIVSGVKSIDDANAVYTVGAKLSTGNWMYVNIPVYYDKDNVGFAVSGLPAFAPAPAKITVPQAESPFSPDGKLADTIKSSVMEQFFPAWASSNTAGINLIVLANANSEAKMGLSNSVKFVSIQSFTVEQKQPDAPDETTRKAQATVVWASPTDPKITYTQQYNLILFRQPDNRWYIKELTSGVRS